MGFLGWYFVGVISSFSLFASVYEYEDEKVKDEDVSAIWIISLLSWGGVSMILFSWLGKYLRTRNGKDK